MTTNNIHKDFIEAQKQFEPARKTSDNNFHKSKYADLSVCIDAVKDALNNNNFYLKQINHDCENAIAIETVLVHSSGEIISSGILKVPASKQDAQGYGSAMTYARRYSLMAVCGIAPEDDDANSAKSKLKSKEDLILEAEKVASLGMKSLETWWKGNITKEERDSISYVLPSLKSKAEQVDDLNQDINQ